MPLFFMVNCLYKFINLLLRVIECLIRVFYISFKYFTSSYSYIRRNIKKGVLLLLVFVTVVVSRYTKTRFVNEKVETVKR